MTALHSCITTGIFIGALLSACGGGKPDAAAEVVSHATPATLIVEQEISGTVLGSVLRQPFGVAVAADGTVYCVDRGNDRLIKFRPDLTAVRDAGGTGTAAGLLSRPGYVAVDNTLNVLVSDEGNQRISRFNADLLFVEAIEFYDPDSPSRFGTPSGVAVNRYGEMWVADRRENHIALYNNQGAFDRYIAGFGYQGGQVQEPEKITLDAGEQFCVADAGNNRVIIYDQYGNHAETISSSAFDHPVAAIPLRNTTWVLDRSQGRLYYCDRQGRILFAIGPDLPGIDRALREPSDMALLPDGRLLLSDSGNNRLLVCRIIGDDR